MIAKDFKGKTELQIKNRFYKVLSPLKKKVEKMLRMKGIKKNKKSEWL